jgi:hypothetical protein
MYVFEFETEVRFLSWRKLFYKSYTQRFFSLANEDESQVLMTKLHNLRIVLTSKNTRVRITLVNRVSIGSIEPSLVECSGVYVSPSSIPYSELFLKSALKYQTPTFMEAFKLIVGEKHWKTLARVGEDYYNF